MLHLQAIQFNHNSSCASCDALNIRKNEQDLVEIPEWRRGVSTKPEHSPAAYARLETQGNTLTIQANFSFEGAGPQDVCIQALDANFHQEPVNGSLSPEEVQLLQNLIPNPAGNVIGEVKPKTIMVNTGETGFQFFDLQRARIGDAGVGVQNIVWRWQYRFSGTTDWIDLAVTTHRIYTVLQVPKLPWFQDYMTSNTQLPWVEILDHACDWASGARNMDDAAAMITRRVNDLGPSLIHFDMVNFGSSHYSDNNNFDGSAFLCRLRGETSHGPRVNCSDCAAVVSTFANIVGCDLEQSTMRPPVQGLAFFPLKEHLRIGLPNTMQAGFFYHEVAWEGQAGESDEVFDACVQVDGDNNPGTFSALLPTNLVFGGQCGYRFRLVLTGNEGLCIPRPDLKTRRRLGPVSSPKALPEVLDLLKGVYNYNLWEKISGPGTRHFIFDYFFTDFALPGWQIINKRHSGTRGERPFIQSFWKKEEWADDVVLRIDVCEASIWTDAREILLTFLTQCQLPGIVFQAHQPELGDVALAGPEPCTILFATTNLAFLVRNVGADVSSVMEIATAITEKLLHPPLIHGEKKPPFRFVKEFRFGTDETFLGDTIQIIEDSSGSPTEHFYQFFAAKGEVFLRGRELFYRPLEVGQHTLNIFAVNNVGAVPTQQLSLTVRGS